MYTPKPIDCEIINLPAYIEQAIELLAKNAHDIWAQKRIEEGWSLGPRNDKLKQNPCLVPYDELPESEKEYDRNAVTTTVKALIGLGYKIEKSDNEQTPEPERGLSAEDIYVNELLKSDSLDSVQKLISFCYEGSKENRKGWSAGMYSGFGKKVLSKGDPFLAYDIVTEGIKRHFANDITYESEEHRQLIQQQALALQRLNKLEEAKDVLLQMYENSGVSCRSRVDNETAGILGGIFKRLWQKYNDKEYLEKAKDVYLEGFRCSNETDYYTGINVACLALYSGNLDQKNAYASKTISICAQKLESGGYGEDVGEKYWVLVSQAEAYLLLLEFEKSLDAYKKAFNLRTRDYGNQLTTKKQALGILDFFKTSGYLEETLYKTHLPELRKLLDTGSIIYYTGHMIDAKGRASERFPEAKADVIRNLIRDALEGLNAKIGYGSAACGTDIIFAEEMLARNRDVNIHIPFNGADFLRESVSFAGGQWEERYLELKEKSTRWIESVKEKYLGHRSLFTYGNSFLIGKTLEACDTLGMRPHMIAVWDGKTGDGPFGTAHNVKVWTEAQGYENLTVIDVETLTFMDKDILKSKIEALSVDRKIEKIHEVQDCNERIPMAVVFSDVVGFSKIEDSELVIFNNAFMSAIKQMMDSKGYKPEEVNTWGDGLVCYFGTATEAARFSLDLIDCVKDFDCKGTGMSCELNIRVGAHFGPVYKGCDPIREKNCFFGAHINRSARIEPITSPGHVYVSEHFAAILRLENPEGIRSVYLGQFELAKGFGVFPIYHLARC
ncbi:MAG: DUF4071 domain-containing protein [Nitrospirae bacterium]|nr:DUF4071 domain-containing protein [Nitrospirota bacterium]